MSKLKTNTIRHVDGSNDNITLDSSQNVTVEGVLKTDSLRHTGASSDAITLATDGTCTAKITNNLSNRNLIINGAMQVAQRSTAAVNDDSYRTVDRFALSYSGTDNHPTQAQHALTSSDTGPWEKGFRYSYHVTNGDQTSGAGTGDKMEIIYKIEAQDMANSGWNYTSTSSYITFSFWVKSSKAQNFYGYILSLDGTTQNYPFETGNLSANTWTKITKTIPGNSNIQFDNNAAEGLRIVIQPFMGTASTGSVSLNAWAALVSDTRTPNQTSDWWLENDATFEITGMQLEVGDVATDFEHRSYGDELARCQRYYYHHVKGSEGSNGQHAAISDNASMYNATSIFLSIPLPVTMRAKPDLVDSNATDYYLVYCNNAASQFDTFGIDAVTTKTVLNINTTTDSMTSGNAALARTNHANAIIAADAEL